MLLSDLIFLRGFGFHKRRPAPQPKPVQTPEPKPSLRLPLWEAVIDGKPMTVNARTKSHARAAVKRAAGKPIPPGTKFRRVV